MLNRFTAAALLIACATSPAHALGFERAWLDVAGGLVYGGVDDDIVSQGRVTTETADAFTLRRAGEIGGKLRGVDVSGSHNYVVEATGAFEVGVTPAKRGRAPKFVLGGSVSVERNFGWPGGHVSRTTRDFEVEVPVGALMAIAGLSGGLPGGLPISLPGGLPGGGAALSPAALGLGLLGTVGGAVPLTKGGSRGAIGADPLIDDVLYWDVDVTEFGRDGVKGAFMLGAAGPDMNQTMGELALLLSAFGIDLFGMQAGITTSTAPSFIGFSAAASADAAPVPVPAALPLLGGGLGALAALRRRRKA